MATLSFKIAHNGQISTVTVGMAEDVNMIYKAIRDQIPSLNVDDRVDSITLIDLRRPGVSAQKIVFKDKSRDPARPNIVSDKGIVAGSLFSVVLTHVGGSSSA
eukprot:m.29226 g.29226  ORF g.29226 m.29226 type:complete len:103 (+) comp10400_c0_seq1:74-382(+)